MGALNCPVNKEVGKVSGKGQEASSVKPVVLVGKGQHAQ